MKDFTVTRIGPSTCAAEHGGSLVQETMALGEHGFCALAQGSEGNLVGFHSMA